MTDELKAKLREILLPFSRVGGGMDDYGALTDAELLGDVDETIAQIDQAYKDQAKEIRIAVEQLRDAPIPAEGRYVAVFVPDGYMAGQELYDRFLSLVDGTAWSGDVEGCLAFCKDMARRAAGLK